MNRSNVESFHDSTKYVSYSLSNPSKQVIDIDFEEIPGTGMYYAWYIFSDLNEYPVSKGTISGKELWLTFRRNCLQIPDSLRKYRSSNSVGSLAGAKKTEEEWTSLELSEEKS